MIDVFYLPVTMEETLGQRLARLRKEHGLNQTQVGEAIGVEKSTISTYESGSRQVSIDILVALAKYYHVTIDYLLGAGSEKIIPADGLKRIVKSGRKSGLHSFVRFYRTKV